MVVIQEENKFQRFFVGNGVAIKDSKRYDGIDEGRLAGLLNSMKKTNSNGSSEGNGVAVGDP